MVFVSPGRQPSTSTPKTCWVFGPASIWKRGSPVVSVEISSSRRPSIGSLATPGASRTLIAGAAGALGVGAMDASGASAATSRAAITGTIRRIRTVLSDLAGALGYDARRAVDRVEIEALVPGRVAPV